MATKLLLVDDSIVVRNKLKEVFINDSFVILEAENGFKALEVIKGHADIDVMICDVNMPEMNGIELCKIIHEEKLNEKLFILMLTTEASPDLKESAKTYGVKAWITKPFNPKAIQAVMQKIVALKKT